LDVAEETGSGYDFASEASAKGAIEIHDTDHDGKFIKLFNTGEEVAFFTWLSYIAYLKGLEFLIIKFVPSQQKQCVYHTIL